MNPNQTLPGTTPQSLGNGLVLRYSLPQDIDRLAELVVRVFSSESRFPDERYWFWVQDLLAADNPDAFKPFGLIVEESAANRIVSALISIPQVWQYAGSPIKVGRPEAVVTDEKFRGRGLVRALMSEFHCSSLESGDLMQGITGIPWFYRQFGYEMAVELGGSRSAFETQVVAAAKLDKAGRSIRPARHEDIPFLHAVYEASTRRYLLSAILNQPWWQNELINKHPESITHSAIYVMQSADNQPSGFMILASEMEDQAVEIRYLEIQEGHNWQGYMPLVLETAWEFGQKLAAKLDKLCTRVAFQLGSQHPAFHAAAEFLPEVRRPYNWYLRVADLPKFIRHVAPVLESRLAQSPFCAYSGSVRISFYKNDLYLEFQSGLITKAETVPTGDWQKADIRFPDLTFLQLLFGYRSARELVNNFADCGISEKYIPFLDTLFPKQPSLVFPVE